MTYQTHDVSGYANMWQRRTILEKVLISFYLLVGAVAVTSLVAYVIIKHDTGDSGMCLTTGCIATASRILNAIDESVEPCDDFYQFACGKFIRETYIPDDKLTVDTFNKLSDQIDIQLRTIIEADIDPNESKVFKLVKKMHKSCMNRTAVEALGLDAFKQIISNIGGWPAVEGDLWNETAWDWIDAIGKMKQIGLTTNYLISTSVGAHLKNSSRRSLRIDQPELGLAREFLLNEREPTLQHYYDYMVDMTIIFGANVSTAPFELLDVLNLERALANISIPNEERRNGEAQFNPNTIAELQVKYPHVRWMDYFEALMTENIQLTENEEIVVVAPIYFERLADILASTSKRTIANYFMWRSLGVSSNFLNDQVRMRKVMYLGSMSQSDGQPGQSGTTQWRECVSYTAATLSPAVGALYVRKFFKDKSKQHAIEIVENIRGSFIEMLQKVDWMDENTKNAAVAKANSLIAHIAYPEELVNDTKLEEYYKDLEMDEDQYLLNALRLNQFKTHQIIEELYMPVDKNEWLAHSTPAMTNAFYSALENSIQFPAGILQGQFLGEDRPNYINYGTIGQIIGHEITHGFDDLGRQFDKNGNLQDWWDPETKLKFLNKTKCIIDQYSNYTVPKLNLKVNGKATQGENIADNGGMKSAYFAYKKWIQQNGNEKSLPGLKYSSQEMYWIAAAQTWCSASRDWFTKMTTTVDTHAPSRFRVLGSVTNNKEFAEDFKCKSGSNMNPVNKCEIW